MTKTIRPRTAPQAPTHIFNAAQAVRLNQDEIHPESKAFTKSEVLTLATTLRHLQQSKNQGPYLSRDERGPIVRRHRTAAHRGAICHAMDLLLEQTVQQKDPWLFTRWSRSGAREEMQRRIFNLLEAIELGIFDLDPEAAHDVQTWKTPVACFPRQR